MMEDLLPNSPYFARALSWTTVRNFTQMDYKLPVHIVRNAIIYIFNSDAPLTPQASSHCRLCSPMQAQVCESGAG
jgi:hypothetical protein